ncbi:MAG: hypothetical protein AAGG09_11835 [Pseudomonadota bacterium]
MPLSTLAASADLIAALGVIASLLFLATELRRSNRANRQANWRQLLDSYSAFKAVTNDLAYAEFLSRARQDYHALSAGEKLSFGHYQEQGIHVMSNFYKHDTDVPEEVEGLIAAIDAVMLDHLDNPGARAWLAESRIRGRLRRATYAKIDALLARGGRAPASP